MTNLPKTFQKRVKAWMMECFSMEVTRDGVERNHRFIEEALELVQSLGCTRSEAHQLVDYVFDRPVGAPEQGLGGAMVTLAALAGAHDMSLMEAAETELARVWTKIDQIRAKQASKPKHSPLPEAAPGEPVGEPQTPLKPEALHYLGAIKVRLESLYELLPDDPRLREHISDELDWIEGEIERISAAPLPRLSDESGDHHKLDTDRQVFFYEHDFYVLSNFSAFTLNWKGWRFDTSEAAYHWEKFAHMNEVGIVGGHECHQCYVIRRAESAHAAFKIAEANKSARRADWDDVKVGIMREILVAKVNQHEYVHRKLLATGDRELIEDSWRDDFWGWGPNRDGQNILGKLWMEVRDELRASTLSRPVRGGEAT